MTGHTGPARLSALCGGVLITAAGRAFSSALLALPSASSWQEAVVPPGGAPTQPECAACEATPAGAAPAKARNCRAPATEGPRLFSGAASSLLRHQDASRVTPLSE